MSNTDTQIIVTYDNICHVENLEFYANNFYNVERQSMLLLVKSNVLLQSETVCLGQCTRYSISRVKLLFAVIIFFFPLFIPILAAIFRSCLCFSSSYSFYGNCLLLGIVLISSDTSLGHGYEDNEPKFTGDEESLYFESYFLPFM